MGSTAGIADQDFDINDYVTETELTDALVSYLNLNETADQKMKGTFIIGDKIDGGSQNAVGLERVRQKVHFISDHKMMIAAIEVMVYHGGVNKSRYKVMGDGTVKLGNNLINDEEVGITLNPAGSLPQQLVMT